MSLVKGTNSYATVEEADSYFEDRYDVDEWDSATHELKAKALVTATTLIDTTVDFFEEKLDKVQRLSIPMKGMTEIPEDISIACCEVALEILVQETVSFTENTTELSRLKASTVSLDFYNNPGSVLSVFNSIAKGFLRRYGSSSFGSNSAVSNVKVTR